MKDIIRARILSFLENLSFEIKEENWMRKQEMEVAVTSRPGEKPVSVLVIPTDEEIVIAYDTLFIGHLKHAIMWILF
jgi:acetate kinase